MYNRQGLALCPNRSKKFLETVHNQIMVAAIVHTITVKTLRVSFIKDREGQFVILPYVLPEVYIIDTLTFPGGKIGLKRVGNIGM